MNIRKFRLKAERKVIQMCKVFRYSYYNDRFVRYQKRLDENILGIPVFVSDNIQCNEIAPECK